MKLKNLFHIAILIGAVCLALWPLSVLKAGPVTADMGGLPVVVLSRSVAFGARHAVGAYTTVHLSKDGRDYVSPSSPEWVWVDGESGQRWSDHASNFRIRLVTPWGRDGHIVSPYRTFPDEAIEPVKAVTTNDTVVVLSRQRAAEWNAHVLGKDPAGGTVRIDYPALLGDSESRVVTTNGIFVGFISFRVLNSSGVSVGAEVSTPGFESLAGTTSTPRPAPEIPAEAPPGTKPPPESGPAPTLPVITQADVEKAVAAAKAAERTALAAQLQALLDKLKQ